MSAGHWYKVTFLHGGGINSIERWELPETIRSGALSMYVQAADEEQARKKALNAYCAKKKKEKIVKLHAAGHCACGRRQDRKHPAPDQDQWMLTCSVCAARRAQQHVRRSNSPVPLVRDEDARVESMQTRVRDRKNEMRLEVLCEVRQKWQTLQTNGQFTQWLGSEILKATQPREAAE